MKVITPLTPASFTSDHHHPLQITAPTAVPLSGSTTGEGSGGRSDIRYEIPQDRAGENESDEEAWNTVHVREVGLWIMGSRAEDGGYVSVGGVHFGPSGSD